jgi:hypothetical protein
LLAHLHSACLSEEIEEGHRTPQRDIELIKARLKRAEEHYKEIT